MSRFYDSVLRKGMFALDAETAHTVSIKALKAGLHPRYSNAKDKRLKVDLAGLNFPNPIGMAAGYDKQADVPDALLAMGFGHTEVGTITPLAQPGNPRPRVFRLVEDEGVINRFGFNSKGHADALSKLQARKEIQGIIGVNIGANKTSDDFAADYVKGIEVFGDLATYFTVNISSPNTPGLRALQGSDPLNDLMGRASEARANLSRHMPIFLKVAPDLDESEMDSIAKAILASDFDALIVSNTTLERVGLKDENKKETGGLSGRPLFERSTIVLAKMYQRLAGRLPLIGVGGVDSSETAFSKIEAGASLVQLYSGMIFKGPGLPGDISNGLSEKLDQEGLDTIKDVIGRRAEFWAGMPLS